MHEGSPSYAFDAPYQYSCLSDEQKASMTWLNSDFCIITHEGQTDYFIRTVLLIPIHGVTEPFMWGVWASLSERSFRRYYDTYDDPVEGDRFFGWVCNRVPWYPKPESSLAADVLVQLHGQRPLLRLHDGSENNHPLVLDQRDGITVQKAQEIAEYLRHAV